MRILQLIHVPRDPDGGAAGVALRLAQEWRASGHDVVDVYGEELSNVRGRRLRDEHQAVRAAQRGICEARRVDVIYATGHLGWILFPLLARRPKRPLLVAASFGLEHTDRRAILQEAKSGTVPMPWSSRLFGGVTRLPEVSRSISRSDLFVGLLETTCAEVIRSGWKSAERCVTSGCGVPDEFAQMPWRAPEKPWEGRVVWCGTTIERKGWVYFGSAMKRFAVAQPLEVHVVGSGAEDPVGKSIELSMEWGCDVRVYPPLTRHDQAELLRSADVFVSTSLSEGFHRALLEAMTLGVPCIATPTGFVADTEDGGSIVQLVPFRDSNAVTESMAQLAEDGLLRERLSLSGREFASRFNWREIARRLVEGFERVDSVDSAG